MMMRNMVTSLFEFERVVTTEAKAKAVKPLAEKMITLAKRGDLHARRQALGILTKKSVTHKLFSEIKDRYMDRAGGYASMVKIGPRKGDAAEMAVLQLIKPEDATKASKKKARKKKGAPKKAAQPTQAAPKEDAQVKAVPATTEEETAPKVEAENAPETEAAPTTETEPGSETKPEVDNQAQVEAAPAEKAEETPAAEAETEAKADDDPKVETEK
jgi:large subunit ribosomal protein L17